MVTKLLFVMMAVMLFIPVVHGAALLVDSTGSTDVVIGQATENQLTKTTQASNVTITDIVTEIETTHWSAFLGNVTANVALTGGESQGIFEFTLNGSNIDGIAATTDPNFDWGNLQPITALAVDRFLNLSVNAADSVTLAFNTTDSYLGVGDLLTQNLRNSTALDSNWATSIGADVDNGSIDPDAHLHNIAFLGTLNDGQQIENFMGGTSEYQMLVGVNETDEVGLQIEVTYNFWLLERQN